VPGVVAKLTLELPKPKPISSFEATSASVSTAGPV
jgi:hypothetical protein